MSPLPAQTIRNMQPPLVTPFFERTIESGMSWGLGPSGYDVRVAETVQLDADAGICFALASTIERFQLPADVCARVHDKSSWARNGVALQNTFIEAGWRGFLTLELTYHRRGFIEIPAGSAIAHIVFERLEAPTELPYPEDGKYQDQAAGPQPARYQGAAPKRVRHSWGEPQRDPFRTVRVCRKCGLVRVTRHDGDGLSWVEFTRDGVRLDCVNTPPCEEAP